MRDVDVGLIEYIVQLQLVILRPTVAFRLQAALIVVRSGQIDPAGPRRRSLG